MARDSRNALVALNRFGFGARGGASGDFVNAASDPRGFVKADLGRVNAALLEVPGLQPTPDLAKAVFEFQFERKQAREAAKSATAGAATETAPQQAAPDAQQRRGLSLANIAQDISPKDQPVQPTANNAAPPEMMQSNAPPKPAPPQ